MHNRLNLSYGWVLIISRSSGKADSVAAQSSTMRSSLRMQELQPARGGAEEYKGSVQQREAIMKIYRDAGVSPFAGLTGCLLKLLPMPILFALFVFQARSIHQCSVSSISCTTSRSRIPYYILPGDKGFHAFSSLNIFGLGMRSQPNPRAKTMGYMFPVMMTVVLLNRMASGAFNLHLLRPNIFLPCSSGYWRRGGQGRRHARRLRRTSHHPCVSPIGHATLLIELRRV